MWEAGSAWAWKRACGRDGEQVTDLVERGGWGRVSNERKFEEVDEFTRMTLEITFGSEMMERWEAGAL